jgi:hypothetical protein
MRPGNRLQLKLRRRVQMPVGASRRSSYTPGGMP